LALSGALSLAGRAIARRDSTAQVVRHQTHEQCFLHGKLRAEQHARNAYQHARPYECRHHAREGVKDALNKQAPADERDGPLSQFEERADATRDHHADEQSEASGEVDRRDCRIGADVLTREHECT